VQVFFKGGAKTERVEVEFPIGHRKRRAEGIPVLVNKFEKAIAGRLSARQCTAINALCSDQKELESTPVNEFMALWTV